MDPSPPPSIPPSPPPTEQGFRLGAVIRDVAIVFVLTFLGGFIIGIAAPPTSPRGVLAIAVSNLLLGTVGFIISGCLAVGNRWRHLTQVALGAWLASLVNVVLFHVTMAQWASGVIFIGLMMGLGGALSYIFCKP